MSYILDALKKLETEKELKARGSGMINIAGELLKNGPAPPRERRNWPLILVLVLLTSLIIFGATFLLLHGGKGKGKRRHTVPPPVVVPTPSAAVSVPVPKPSAPVPMPTATPPAAAPPHHAVPLPAKAPAAAKTPPAPRHPPVAKPAASATRVAKKRSNAPMKPAKPAAVSLVAAPADIKVSGIAWQDHRSSSRAVVNGFLLREGDTVSGARVVEIFQNRVRFSSAAGTFEVSLMANGLPGPAK